MIFLRKKHSNQIDYKVYYIICKSQLRTGNHRDFISISKGHQLDPMANKCDVGFPKSIKIWRNTFIYAFSVNVKRFYVIKAFLLFYLLRKYLWTFLKRNFGKHIFFLIPTYLLFIIVLINWNSVKQAYLSWIYQNFALI